jgi:hypothetical protein
MVDCITDEASATSYEDDGLGGFNRHERRRGKETDSEPWAIIVLMPLVRIQICTRVSKTGWRISHTGDKSGHRGGMSVSKCPRQ